MTDDALTELVTRWCEPTPTPEEITRAFASQYRRVWDFWVVSHLGVALDRPRPRYDFANDLNACAKFEALLRERGLKSEWTLALEGLVIDTLMDEPPINKPGEYIFDVATASARQRSEALVRMIGGSR